MEKRLVVTRADNKIQTWSDITHPIIRRYADKCNADFKVINNDVQDNSRCYVIFELYDLFNGYDRIIQIDTDTLIMKHCPNLFDVVPKDKFGTIYEDVGSRKKHRRDLIKKVQSQRSNVNWDNGYINMGVCVISKEHKEILKPSDSLWMDFGYADIECAYRIHKLGYEVFELDYNFNHMSMFSEEWNSHHSRFDANIIHYAGNGFDSRISRFDQMTADYNILKRYNLIDTENNIITNKKLLDRQGSGWSKIYSGNFNGKEVILKKQVTHKSKYEQEKKVLELNIDNVVNLIDTIDNKYLVLEKLNRLPKEISKQSLEKLILDSIVALRKLYLNGVDWIAKLNHIMMGNNKVKLIDFNDDTYKHIPFFNFDGEGIITFGACDSNGVYTGKDKTPYSGWVAVMGFLMYYYKHDINLSKIFDKLVEIEYQSLCNVHQPINFGKYKDYLKTLTEKNDSRYGELIKPNRNCIDRFNIIKNALDFDLSDKTFLDVGTNVGWFCFEFCKIMKECTGIDIDSDMINFNTMMSELNNIKNIKFNQCNFTLDYIDTMCNYDIISALSILHWYVINPPEGSSQKTYTVGKDYFYDMIRMLAAKSNKALILEFPPYVYPNIDVKNVDELCTKIKQMSNFKRVIVAGVSDAKRPIIIGVK